MHVMLLNELSAADAARRIAARSLTSEALVEACLERIARRDGEVHAWAYLDREQALAEARLRDREPARGPLHGIPFGIKDIIDTGDMPTEYNSPIYRGRQPKGDAACVALLRRAGCVILGKTVTTEFATNHPSQTRNPHNPAHTPGGSSSGSAAAVAEPHGAARARHADRRVGDPAGRVLRHRRLQAELRQHQPRRAQVRRRVARHDRRLRPQRGRSCPCIECVDWERVG